MLEKKVTELVAQVEQSAANHHMLLGSKMTWESLLAEAKKTATEVKSISETVEATAAAVEAALDKVN